MPALPADIAKYTNDGIVITAENTAIDTAHPDALDLIDEEIEMFFADEDDAQVLLDEKFTYLSKINPVHLGIEVEESLGLGTTIAITPVVPSFTVIDETRNVDTVARTRAFAYESETDRYSIEVIE